ncbi:hypothetical protein D3C81_1165390 [compost metagenome]
MNLILHACVIDEDIDTSEGLIGGTYKLLHIFLFRHVALYWQRLPAAFMNVLDQLIQLFAGGTVINDHIGFFLPKTQCHSLANPA